MASEPTSAEGARFEALFTANARVVLGYALRRVAHPEDAADVVAETFWVAWRRLDDVPADARPWLLAVARRVLANQRRGALRRERLTERMRGELRVNVPAIQHADETNATVRGALAALCEPDREVLLLSMWEGLSPAEIARVCGVPAVTVRTRLHRARRRLRAELEAAGFRPTPSAVPLNAGERC